MSERVPMEWTPQEWPCIGDQANADQVEADDDEGLARELEEEAMAAESSAAQAEAEYEDDLKRQWEEAEMAGQASAAQAEADYFEEMAAQAEARLAQERAEAMHAQGRVALAELKREAAIRRVAFPRWVAQGKLTPAEAKAREAALATAIEIVEAALADLEEEYRGLLS